MYQRVFLFFEHEKIILIRNRSTGMPLHCRVLNSGWALNSRIVIMRLLKTLICIVYDIKLLINQSD